MIRNLDAPRIIIKTRTDGVAAPAHRPRTLLLTGPAGSGKTAVLAALAARGEQVLDLEGMAGHRGSAFGATPLPQPSHRRFQIDVRRALARASLDRVLWVEDEGPFIGSVGLPADVLRLCDRCEAIALAVPRARRVARIVAEYQMLGIPALLEAIERIERRLGTEKALAARELLRVGAVAEAASLLLAHYDAAYAARRRHGPLAARVQVEGASCEEVAEALCRWVEAQSRVRAT